jgi:hypothetical protein
VELVTVSDAHEVVIPRGLKVQAPEPNFESDWEGVELPMEYLQVPEVLIEASANIVEKAESVLVYAICPRPPAARGLPLLL